MFIDSYIVKNMGKQVFDLHDYAFSKKVCEELPKLKQILVETEAKLQAYKHYSDAGSVLDEIQESLLMIGIQLEYHTKVKDSKGSV